MEYGIPKSNINGKPNLKGKKSPKVVSPVARITKAQPKVKKSSNARGSYLALYKNPFDRASFGAKMQDPASPYTNSYNLHGEFKIVNNSTSNTTAAYCFKPNPFLGVIDVQSWSGGVSTSSAAGWAVHSNNSYLWGFTTPAGLSAVMSNYRVVAHGLRLRLETPQLSVTGRMIIARAPRTRADPPNSAMDSTLSFTYQTGTSSGYTITTLPLNGVGNSPYLLEVPEAVEISLPDMIGRDVTIINAINSPAAMEFSICGDATNSDIIAGNTLLTEMQQVTASTSAFVAGYVTDNKAGWDDFYIYFDGLPTGSSAIPIVNVEVILHLEGMPTLSTSSSITPIPSHPPIVGSRTTFQQIMDVGLDMARVLIEDASTVFLNRMSQPYQQRLTYR